MTEKVKRQTEAETGVSQELLDAHYDAVDAANEAAAAEAAPTAEAKAVAPAEDKGVAAPAKPKPATTG